MRISRGLCAGCAAAAALLAPALTAGKPLAKKPVHKAFVPHLCAWAMGGEASLELEGGCHERQGHPKTVQTPHGSATTELDTAKWGVPKLDPGPQHLLSVAVSHVTGSSAVVAYFRTRERARVLARGQLVMSSKSVIASWSGETSSCKNPPTGDCTSDAFESLKGSWGVLVNVVGAPPGSPGAAEEESPTGEDDAQDLAQEELLKPATVGIGLAVTGKL